MPHFQVALMAGASSRVRLFHYRLSAFRLGQHCCQGLRAQPAANLARPPPQPQASWPSREFRRSRHHQLQLCRATCRFHLRGRLLRCFYRGLLGGTLMAGWPAAARHPQCRRASPLFRLRPCRSARKDQGSAKTARRFWAAQWERCCGALCLWTSHRSVRAQLWCSLTRCR